MYLLGPGTTTKTITDNLNLSKTLLGIDAILNKSKEQAIACLAVDPNVGSFVKAESMFDEMSELQKEYLSYFK